MRYTLFGLLLIFSLSLPSQGVAKALLSHRAHYKLSLENTPNQKKTITDVQGTLTLELQKTCEGWYAQQYSSTSVFKEDNSVERVRWGYVIWESKDHKTLRFSTYRKVNEELTEEQRGEASMHTREALYKMPTSQTIPLPEKTLFPIAHLKETLRKTNSQEKIFPSPVFDGSSGIGVIQLNTFIGEKRTADSTQADSPLENAAYFPIQIAIFEPDNQGMSPDYETQQDLTEDGIVRRYKVLYDELVLKGTLERIEMLPDMLCNPKKT